MNGTLNESLTINDGDIGGRQRNGGQRPYSTRPNRSCTPWTNDPWHFEWIAVIRR
jgi:hypothetical protein